MSQTIRMTVDTPPSSPPAESTLSFADGRLLRSGEPYRLMAGSMHYFRVHPGQWADRMSRLADLGVNAVDTYVAWVRKHQA